MLFLAKMCKFSPFLLENLQISFEILQKSSFILPDPMRSFKFYWILLDLVWSNIRSNRIQQDPYSSDQTRPNERLDPIGSNKTRPNDKLDPIGSDRTRKNSRFQGPCSISREIGIKHELEKGLKMKSIQVVCWGPGLPRKTPITGRAVLSCGWLRMWR